MKKTLCLLVTLLAITGCASSGTNDRLDALELEIASVKRTADQALETAKDAQSKASSLTSSVSEAQRMARQAMDTATETAERLSRMEEECCGGK